MARSRKSSPSLFSTGGGRMTSTVTLAFLHHATAFLLVAVVTVELVLMRELTLTTARSLLRMDAVYGVAALVMLAVGFLRVFYTEKTPAYTSTAFPSSRRSRCSPRWGCSRSIPRGST